MPRRSGPRLPEYDMEVWDHEGIMIKACHGCGRLHKLINSICGLCIGKTGFEMNEYIYQDIPYQDKNSNLKQIKAVHRWLK